MARTRFLTNSLLISVSMLALMGCTAQDREAMVGKSEKLSVQDRELGYNRDDYRKAMAPRPLDTKNNNTGVPDLAPVISDDKKNILPQPLVSITVNQDVPLRDIFYELAKQAEVDLELDPTITGSIIFTAYNRPFDQVVERISDMAGLRYHFENNVLRVERDTPYVKSYHVGYLSVQRDTTSSINSNTSASSGSGGGGANGSSSSIVTKSSTDFWNELETNITQIIRNTNQQVALTDTSTPVIMTPNAIPAVSAAQLTAVAGATTATGAAAPGAVTPGAPGAAGAAPAATPQPVPNATTNAAGVAVAQNAPTAGMLNPTGATATGAAGTAGGAAGGTTGAATANPYYSVNRQAGIINVFASEKQQKKIGEYIKATLESINTQVLIEAKVFEVELNDQNSLGIDWRLVSDDVSGVFALPQQNFLSGTQFPAGAGAVFQYTSGDFNAVVNAISRFGTVRTLSSPRLSVMNNQSAVLNVSENRVFFDLDVQQTQGTLGTGTLTTITSEVKTVPEGIVINVHPSVDPDTNEITMNLRPSITRVVRTVADPAVAFVAQQGNLNIENQIPELSTREIDSMVKMNSGNAIIMGGLMQDRVESEQISVPVLGEIPLLGALFRSQRDLTHKTEMIIMLRAVVVNNPQPDQTDRDLYKNMSQDRRPFNVE